MRSRSYLSKTIIVCLSINFIANLTLAQKKMNANYRLSGIQDLAAGFQFRDDGTFSFFYMYGAVDRFAKGTYSISNDTIKLHSSKEPGKDFTIMNQSEKKNGYKVVVKDKNQYLISYVTAIVFNGEEKTSFESDKDGNINIDGKRCDKIYLKHELYPDIVTEIKNEQNPNNYFEVALNPSLQEISFKGIDLFIDGPSLRCHTNYFLPFENIVFEKED